MPDASRSSVLEELRSHLGKILSGAEESDDGDGDGMGFEQLLEHFKQVAGSSRTPMYHVASYIDPRDGTLKMLLGLETLQKKPLLNVRVDPGIELTQKTTDKYLLLELPQGVYVWRTRAASRGRKLMVHVLRRR